MLTHVFALPLRTSLVNLSPEYDVKEDVKGDKYVEQSVVSVTAQTVSR